MAAVTVYYLQMDAPGQLRAARAAEDLLLMEARVRQFPLNRFLYQFVGGPWGWTDKLGWSDARWRDYVHRDALRTWVAYSEGSPAGYFELERQPGNAVEIKYFGLAEAFIGRGYGGHLLTRAIEQAWNWGPVERLWVHTCSLDHPSALANYQARGMTLYRTDIEPG